MPLWGSWTTYGGGGYTINTAPGMQNYPYGGWLIQRDINQHITLGGEIFSQGRSADNIPAYTIINVGGFYNFTENFSLLFTVGHNIIGQQNTLGYLGFYWTGGI
jgi:outer membrane receptor protein involved in Fe transport